MAYDNTNRGIISRNEDKSKPDANPKWPDFKGQADVCCPACQKVTGFRLSSWIKERKDGTGKFFWVAFKPKDDQQQAKPKAARPAAPAQHSSDDASGDVPF